MSQHNTVRGLGIVVASIGALLVLASAAHAAQPSEVEDLIRRGGDLRKKGQDARALPLYQKAYELARTPRTAAQLGLVEGQLGYRLDAEAHLTEALTAHDDPWVARYRAVLEQQLRKVKSGIGEVVIAGSPEGAEAFVNGQRRGTLPLGRPVRLVAGAATIELRAPGFTTASKTVTVTAERAEHVTLNLVSVEAPRIAASELAPAPAAATTTADAGEPGGGSNWPSYGLIGAGLASAGAGVYWLVTRDACGSLPPGAMCRTSPRSAAPGWVLVGAGAAAVAGGIVLYHRRDVQVGLAVSSTVALVVKGSFR